VQPCVPAHLIFPHARQIRHACHIIVGCLPLTTRGHQKQPMLPQSSGQYRQTPSIVLLSY
jgi:hypothetical protein